MRIHNVLHHGQADARAFDAGGLGRCAAHEFAQNFLLFCRWNSHAAVPHADNNLVPLALNFHPNGLARRGVLGGVVQKVADSPAECFRVSVDRRKRLAFHR